MEHDCLKPAEVPRLSRLYSVFLSNPKKLAEFYAHQPTLSGIREAVRELRKGGARYPDEMRAAVAEVLSGQNSFFAENALPEAIAKHLELLQKGAVAIVTGQQVGLFGGPAYTFYKALSALRVAAQLRKSGISAIPIFWMASEDHDLAEVNHVNWLGENGLERFDWAESDGQLSKGSDEGRSVGNIVLGAGVTAIVRQATDSLGGSHSDEVGEILAAAYQPNQTFGTAFAKLMMAVFGKDGLIILDPLDARFHRLAGPLMHKALAEHAELTAALLAQDKRLEKAGYHAQVKVTERSTLLFATVEGKRLALRSRNGGFSAGKQEYAESELSASIEAHPENFSPNALLRPVVQDTLLPTAVYIGGPAEIAYFAQNRVLYDRLLKRAPATLPRASFSIVEPPIARLLNRYALTMEDVFRGRQHLRRKMERRNIHPELLKQFEANQARLLTLLEALRKPLGKLDPTLLGALDTAKEKMLYQFTKLRGKSGRAVDFRTGVLTRHEKAILGALLPEHDLQERSLSLLPFLARNGMNLLDRLGKLAGLGAAVHRIVRL
jgi:bacillithiol biosynthesis cysteine-adding enzyme BshC